MKNFNENERVESKRESKERVYPFSEVEAKRLSSTGGLVALAGVIAGVSIGSFIGDMVGNMSTGVIIMIAIGIFSYAIGIFMNFLGSLGKDIAGIRNMMHEDRMKYKG